MNYKFSNQALKVKVLSASSLIFPNVEVLMYVNTKAQYIYIYIYTHTHFLIEVLEEKKSRFFQKVRINFFFFFFFFFQKCSLNLKQYNEEFVRSRLILTACHPVYGYFMRRCLRITFIFAVLFSHRPIEYKFF